VARRYRSLDPSGPNSVPDSVPTAVLEVPLRDLSEESGSTDETLLGSKPNNRRSTSEQCLRLNECQHKTSALDR